MNQTPKPTEAEVAQWFARIERGPLTPDEERRFTEWRAEPANEDALGEMERAVTALDPHAEDLLAESFEEELHALSEGSAERRSPWPFAAVAATVVLAASAIFFSLPSTPEPLEPTRYATRIGAQRTVTLDDASVMTLNTGTAVEVALTDDARMVTLDEGEVFFNVERDPSRIFTVDTDHGRVTVIGTSFNVRQTGPETHVSVLSGTVEVSPEGRSPVTLIAGEAVMFRADGEAVLPVRFDANALLSWRGGRLVFDAAPLGEVVEELNRYFVTQIRLGDDLGAEEVVTGTFTLDSQETAVRGISVALGLDVERVPGGIILSRPVSED
ncbi:DUF4880 domain-containing protein [Parvularcula sp. ZS-1/3]|uniref:DUF4880 domain-containing protein n=1 Tax=Parvularcula mediterranea TaxID=2732508 RepID=A0A7Y3RLU2_9PROT|nr:FecR domain-containing protein [Parvularcula mediterranea]NNU15960.1 DUF4880 domain-containing protein [Parvularcula mediterranea]